FADAAIAQTIAEILDSEHFLLASFFFPRNDPQRGTARLLVATLAYQLAVRLPHVFREKVGLAFENDPLILTRSLEAQFKALLLHSGFLTNNHIVVIIDGLDECDDSKVYTRIVDLSFSLVRSRGIPLKILIAGRSEIEVASSFDLKSLSLLARIDLDKGYQSEEDIRHFLADKFNEIKNQHPLRAYIPESWPTSDALDTLVERSSGSHTSTVVKYITSSRHQPTHRLEIVLGIRPPKAGDSPFADLDALYRHILMGAEDVELVLKIIDFVLFCPRIFYGDISVDFVETFFSLPAGDVQFLMQNLGSLISLGDGITPYEKCPVPCIFILHASLKDYLVDQSRLKNLFLDPPKMHTHYAELCLDHIATGTTFLVPV
ncbi:LOW QUALITY PROTEIN: hypothetical protein CVT25_005515, partial [Psilocybe cyanescens]